MLIFFVLPWSAAVWVSRGGMCRAGGGCCYIWSLSLESIQDDQASLYPSYQGIKTNEKRIKAPFSRWIFLFFLFIQRTKSYLTVLA